MSKIGKKPIEIPEGVDVKIEEGLISVKGPKGELARPMIDGVRVVVDGNLIKLSIEFLDPAQRGQGTTLRTGDKKKDTSAKWGLQRALIANMIIGVTEGFNKILEFKGVGYKANVKGSDLELNLGHSHPITISGVDGITFSVEKNTIKVSGSDNELVGKVAAEIRSKRPPEPYKGSGIKYQNEIIKIKAGKKAATAG